MDIRQQTKGCRDEFPSIVQGYRSVNIDDDYTGQELEKIIAILDY